MARQIKYFHVIHATYVGASNFRGSRVKLKSMRFGQSVTIPYDYRAKNLQEIAANYLRDKGFQVLAFGEAGNDGYYVITNTYKSLK